jgi:hypothetical protein
MTTTKPEPTTAEAVAAHMADGLSKTDAITKVAAERDRAVSTIRAAYNREHPTQNGKTKPPADAVEAALALLYTAVEALDAEVTAAEELLKTAGERKALLESKIAALAS